MHGIAIGTAGVTVQGRVAGAARPGGGDHTHAPGPAPVTVRGAEPGIARALGTEAAPETDPDHGHAQGTAAAHVRGPGRDPYRETGTVTGNDRSLGMTRVLSEIEAVRGPHNRTAAPRLMTARMNDLKDLYKDWNTFFQFCTGYVRCMLTCSYYNARLSL